MKKILFTSLLGILCLIATAQKTTEYRASNGITYHLKDTIKLGRGSGQDGLFVYILASFINSSDTQREWFKRKFTGTGLILKSIDIKEVNGIKKYLFTVGSKAMYNMHISIDEAISTCEVLPCSATQIVYADKFSQLKKLKELLDNGAVTQSEYDEQKKKLLSP